jgi:Tfp pilus assembly protein PilE
MKSYRFSLSIINRQLSPRSSRAGFTLMELMIYMGLTAVVIGLFAGILITTTRIQGQQGSSVQVTQELSFLMSTIRRYVQSAIEYTVVDSEHVSITTDLTTSPPTQKNIAYNAVTRALTLTEIGIDGSAVSQLSSSKITIDNIQFLDIREGSSTALHISITASASTTDAGRLSTRTIESTAATLLQQQ